MTNDSNSERYGGRRSSTAGFIAKARAVHGERYDYSLVEYAGSAAKVTIICTLHGRFTQAANNHLAGRNCPGCQVRTGRKPKETA